MTALGIIALVSLFIYVIIGGILFVREVKYHSGEGMLVTFGVMLSPAVPIIYIMIKLIGG